VDAGKHPEYRRRQKEWTMELLRKIGAWWRELWGGDWYWPREVDSHRWENKVEILRRLGT
jgi:hypothetical protein